MVAVVERYMDGAFGACKQQTLSFRIFPNHIGVFVRRNAVGYLSPTGATVVRAINVRTQIVESQSVDRRVGSVLIKMPGIEDGNLLPRSDLFGRNVAPGLATVGGAMNQTIVGTNPNQVHIERRRRHGVDHATLRRL